MCYPGNCRYVSFCFSCLSFCGDGCPHWSLRSLWLFLPVTARFLWASQREPFICAYTNTSMHKPECMQNKTSLTVCSFNPFSYWRVNCSTPVFLIFGLRPAWLPRLTEHVGRRANTHGHPTTASSTHYLAKNSLMLLQIPRTARIHLFLDRYVSWKEKRCSINSGWPHPFQICPRWVPALRKSVTTTWQPPSHCLVRYCWHECINCHIETNHVLLYISEFIVYQWILHWMKVCVFILYQRRTWWCP